MRELDSQVLSTHSDYNCYPSWLVVGIQDLNEVDQLIWIHFVAHLQSLQSFLLAMKIFRQIQWPPS